MEKKTKVSIIVPVYNAEEFIHRCVDSLVYQTLKDIEIILIDNQSTDNTWSILQDYQREFPEKVYIYKLDKHYDGPGAGRNLGLKYAKSKYIGFADSDDFFEYNAFELMYSKATTEKCDLVYVASYDVIGQQCKLTRTLKKGTREEILTVGSMVFWNKLFEKRLFDDAGVIPENMVFEDLAYCSELVSYAKKIGYIDRPLYYYIIREDSGVNTLNRERVLKSLDAEDRGLAKCNPMYIDLFADSVAMRLCNDIRDRWQFADSYIAQLKKISPYLKDNKYFRNDKRNYSRVMNYYSLSDEPMPTLVYVNNFAHDISVKFLKMVEEKAFWEGTQVVLLDEKNCNVWEYNVTRQAYEGKDFETLGNYFALSKIYETGGVYLDQCIELDMTLNYVRFLDVFFSYLDKDNFSDKIFGAIAGNEIIKRLIDLYDNSTANIKRLAELIKWVLNIEQNIPMNNKTNIFSYKAAVFATPVFVIDDGAKLHMACHNFKNRMDSNEYITVKKSSLLLK